MKGSSNWWIACYRGGKLVRESAGKTNCKEAEKVLRTGLGEVATGIWIEPHDRRITVDDLYTAMLYVYRVNGLASLQGVQRCEWKPKAVEQPEPGRPKGFLAACVLWPLQQIG